MVAARVRAPSSRAKDRARYLARKDAARAALDPRAAALLSMLHKYHALTLGTIWPVSVLRLETATKPTGNTIASMEGRGYVQRVPVLRDGETVTTVLVLTPDGVALAAAMEPEGERVTGAPRSDFVCRAKVAR
jgi:DNA-binding MarR family transcriptional regulator